MCKSNCKHLTAEFRKKPGTEDVANQKFFGFHILAYCLHMPFLNIYVDL